MTTSDVLLTADADGVRTFTLNRPQAYNSLTVELKELLLAGLTEAAADDSVRAVVLTGSGKAFCAGQDLKEHVGLLQAGDPAPLHTVKEHDNPLVKTIVGMPKPVIAAVNGPAAGAGAAFAYASDLRIAATSANFLMAFANVGLGPDSGASWTLQRLIGLGRAQKVAAKLAAGPTVAYAKIKNVLSVAAESSLETALAAEDEAQTALGATADHTEAVEAFVGKRKPNFQGK